MTKKILWGVVLFMSVAGFVKAQSGGIQFEQQSWKEICQKAIRENKLIFADFYTEWLSLIHI